MVNMEKRSFSKGNLKNCKPGREAVSSNTMSTQVPYPKGVATLSVLRDNMEWDAWGVVLRRQ